MDRSMMSSNNNLISGKKRTLEESVLDSNSNNNNVSSLTTKTLLFHQQNEIESIQSDLEHERSIHILDNKKYQQHIDRLERQLVLAIDDTKEIKELYELHKVESNKIIHTLKENKMKLLTHIRSLEINIIELQKDLDDNQYDDMDNSEQQHNQKIQQLNAQIKTYQNNEILYHNNIQSLKNEFFKYKQEHDDNKKNTNNNNNTVQQNSPNRIVSPSLLVVEGENQNSINNNDKELSILRLKINDMERMNRQYQKKYDDLLVTYKQSIRDVEKVSMKAKRCDIMEEQVQQLQSAYEQMKAELQPWIIFSKKLIQLKILNKYNNQNNNNNNNNSNNNTLTSSPPDIKHMIQSIENLDKQMNTYQEQMNEYNHTIQTLQIQIETLYNERSILRTSKLDINTEVRTLKNTIQDLNISFDRIQHQCTLYQRETESLRTLLSSSSSVSMSLSNTTSTASSKMFTGKPTSSNSDSIPLHEYQLIQVLYDTMKEQNNILNNENIVLQEKIKTITLTFDNTINELDRMKDKYHLIHDALKNEKLKVLNAIDRANIAEQLAGKGSFNPSITSVYHLSETPYITTLKEEISLLKRQLEHHNNSSNNKQHIPNTPFPKDGYNNNTMQTPGSNVPNIGSSSSRHSTSSSSSSSTTTTTSSVNLDKLNQRLKENFKEQIALFREGVYLLTGYKIDMIVSSTSTTNEKPTFRIRSMYAEQEDDHLLFQWPKTKTPSEKTNNTNNSKKVNEHGNSSSSSGMDDVSGERSGSNNNNTATTSNNNDENDNDDPTNTTAGAGTVITSLDLLNTPLAQFLTTTSSYQYMTNYHSTPAFLASVQLHLFEQQTHIGFG